MRPSTILSACEIRRERKRQDTIDLAVAISNLVLGGFSGETDRLGAVRHLFSEEEYDSMITDREEKRQSAIRQAQIEQLRRMTHG